MSEFGFTLIFPEQNVLQGPFGSTFFAPQPSGQVLVHVSCPGTVQVSALVSENIVVHIINPSPITIVHNKRMLFSLLLICTEARFEKTVCACSGGTITRR
jgi:hypothetical protein